MSLRPFAQQRETITATVLMARHQRFLLVESGAEVKVLKPHVRGRAQIRDLDGRPKVQEAMKILSEEGARNFVALVDADFDEVIGRNATAPRLLYVARSDRRRESAIDLESMLLRTRAIQAVCEHFLGGQLCQLGGPVRFAEKMRESLRAAAAAVGSFRAAVMSVFDEGRSIQGIGDLEHHEWCLIIDVASGDVNRARLEQIIHQRIKHISNFAEVKQRASDFRLSDGDGWLLCRGHDMTEMLALRLTHIAGRSITRRQIEESLYETSYSDLLKETTLGASLHEFCECDLMKEA
jgi:hypothetical protein